MCIDGFGKTTVGADEGRPARTKCPGGPRPIGGATCGRAVAEGAYEAGVPPQGKDPGSETETGPKTAATRP